MKLNATSSHNLIDSDKEDVKIIKIELVILG